MGTPPVGVSCDPLPLRRRGLVDDGLQMVHPEHQRVVVGDIQDAFAGA
jgi:hypothetical protein